MITEDGVERVIPSGGVMITGWENPRDSFRFRPCICALYPTPWISNFFSNPCVTPTTMLFTSVRHRPCRERLSFSSFGRITLTCPSSTLTSIAGFNLRLNVPFGPFTVTVCPSILTSTPAGTAIGFLPILDMLYLQRITRHMQGLLRQDPLYEQPCPS